jgi:GR25 family glycosyltransferase involved in LPS biosynthesis
MKLVQIGSNKGNDRLSEYLLKNCEFLEFGLFVEPNKLHIEELQKQYQKYSNAIIENIAVKLPGGDQENIAIYYHIDDVPNYTLASSRIEYILWHNHLPNIENNYEGKIESFSVSAVTLEELLDKYEIKELDWLLIDIGGLDIVDLLLTFDWKKYNIHKVEFEFLHLWDNLELIKNMFSNNGYVQVNSLNPEKDWAFISGEEYQKICKKNSYKLKNFPPIHFISLDESEDRRNLLYNKFRDWGLKNATPHIFERYKEGKHIFYGEYVEEMIGLGRGPLTSHLRAIKSWYYGSDEPYAFFCEDDISFETVEYWNFTWEEFFNHLPKDWECIQLCWSREKNSFNRFLIEFRPRCWCDWSGCAYLISRKYAKKLIDNYYYDDEFHLNLKGSDVNSRPEHFKIPVLETIIFSSIGVVYGMPLFTEDVNNCKTTFQLEIPLHNLNSYYETMSWWKNMAHYMTLDDLIRYK